MIANPGGALAVQSGCICPVMDNEYGRGQIVVGKQVF